MFGYKGDTIRINVESLKGDMENHLKDLKATLAKANVTLDDVDINQIKARENKNGELVLTLNDKAPAGRSPA